MSPVKLAHDFPPWEAPYQQSRRCIEAGVFDALTDARRAWLRQAHGRKTEPRTSMFDSRTLRSTRESRARAGYGAAKWRKGAKVHRALDPLTYGATSHNQLDYNGAVGRYISGGLRYKF